MWQPDIDRDHLVADLVGLVRIPSVTGDEAAVVADAARRLTATGMTVETLTPDLAALTAPLPWRPQEIPEQYLVLVTCRDEKQQTELLERFRRDGLDCKPLLS